MDHFFFSLFVLNVTTSSHSRHHSDQRLETIISFCEHLNLVFPDLKYAIDKKFVQCVSGMEFVYLYDVTLELKCRRFVMLFQTELL